MSQTIAAQPPGIPDLKNFTAQLDVGQLSSFFPIFQKGVTVPAIVGCTLKSFLCEQMAIPTDYVTERITTIFLDNRPVDDLDRTIIQEGSRVTLSAAMPGLVGATMRRGGFYAALRQGISHASDSGATEGTSGTVRLKLFNLLLAELGPLVLLRGLILERNELDELLHILSKLPDNAPDGVEKIFLSVSFSGVTT
ncbi:MAG: hypothetical protein PHY09_01320 [Desulfuromonadaceae bacterium]|nr:hypothetical protein [Desulfuromonadaceae bacterium]MDD5104956.1 hypothetical protein [Desulfuromonadaceae bacterium]